MRELWRRVGASLVAVVLASTAVMAFSSPAQAERPVKTVSEANGWTFVPAVQNALEQRQEANVKAMGLKADTLFGCPQDYVCLYHWVEYGAGRWQAHPNNLNGTCWNFQNSHYTDGYNVNNTSGSMIVNRDGGIATWLGMYDWVNCNAGGQVWAFDATYWVLKPYLSNLTPQAWHKFTSVTVDYVN